MNFPLQFLVILHIAIISLSIVTYKNILSYHNRCMIIYFHFNRSGRPSHNSTKIFSSDPFNTNSGITINSSPLVNQLITE